MDSKQAEMLMLWISVGMKVLSARALLLVGMLMTFSLFCWATYWPTWERIACVSLFAILVFFPIVKLDGAQAANRAIVDPKENQDG